MITLHTRSSLATLNLSKEFEPLHYDCNFRKLLHLINYLSLSELSLLELTEWLTLVDTFLEVV